MACKSMCEAVVEGMGGVWDRCDRQGNWVTATLEAVVAWNTPKPYHPAAVAFINRRSTTGQVGRASGTTDSHTTTHTTSSAPLPRVW